MLNKWKGDDMLRESIENREDLETLEFKEQLNKETNNIISREENSGSLSSRSFAMLYTARNTEF